MDTMTRYRTAPLRTLQEEVNRIFENVFPSRFDEGDRPALSTVWTPRMDLTETDGTYRLSMDLPGLSKEDVTLSIDDNRLVVSGERHEETKAKEHNVIRMERTFGSFYRSLPLPKSVNEDKINATFKNGVLTVEIPKVETNPPKKIAIK